VTATEPILLPFALAQVAGVLADTVIVVQAAPSGFMWWVDLLSSIATIVIAIALILVAVAVMPVAWYARKVYGVVDKLLARLQQDTKPLVQHAQGAMDNVHYVTTAVRGDVERVQRFIDSAQVRLERSTKVTEQRIREFNALLKVMQEEAEDIFLGTASTVRGVRAGTARFVESDGATAPGDGPAAPEIRVEPRHRKDG
jgi:uncharacterized protein YoxC